MSAILRTDAELAEQIGGGDQAAFDELYQRYAMPLRIYGARMLKDRTAGEDVAQTSLMNAYAALSRGTRPEHVRAWMYRIARNVALEMIERRRDVVADLEDSGGIDRAHETRDLRAMLLAALRTLPERQRRAYVLREVNGLKVSEIAATTGLTVEQVEQSLFLARNKLAEYLAFGDKLDCKIVRTLQAADLGGIQRRAVKSHLRSCVACRSEQSFGGRLAASSPLGLLSWLKDAVAGLFASGAVPVAAKIGAVVVASALVVGAPVVANSRVHMVLHALESRGATARTASEAQAAPAAFVSPVSAAARPEVMFLPPFLQPPAPAAPDVTTAPAPEDPGAPAADAPAAEPMPAETPPPADEAPPPQDPATAADTPSADAPATDSPPADAPAADPSATDPSATDPPPADAPPADEPQPADPSADMQLADAAASDPATPATDASTAPGN